MLFSSIFLLLISVAVGQPSLPNRLLRVASIQSKPFLRAVEGEALYEGFIKDLLDEIAKIQGFDYEIQLSVDKTYGANDGGNWTGLVGMLQREEVDMIGADLTVTPGRMSVVDFSSPFLSSSLTVLLKSSTYPPDVSLYAWFSPLDWTVWLLLLSSYLLTGLLLWLVSKISPWETDPKISLIDSFWFLIVGCWISRDKIKFPATWSTRTITCCWCMFYVTMTVTYFLHLPPHLSHVPPPSRPTTLQQLVDEDITFGVVRSGSTQRLLQASVNPVHQQIWEKVSNNIEDSLVGGYDAGLNKLRTTEEEGRFGMVMESVASDYLMAQDCSLFTVGRLEDRHYAFGFKRDSPYRRLFSQSILELSSNGRLSTIKSSWWPDSVVCETSASSPILSTPVITLFPAQVAAPLIFLAVGLMISLMLLSCELIRRPKHSSGPILHENVATQTVLWASSRASTPLRTTSTSGTMTPSILHHRIYNQDGKLANI